MLAAGKREGGRWAYGESQNSDNLNREMKSRLGVIADHAPLSLCAARGVMNPHGSHPHTPGPGRRSAGNLATIPAMCAPALPATATGPG